MTTRQIVRSADAPAAIGPYSQAVRVGDVVYLSGQIALDPASGALVDGGLETQVEQAFRNLQAVATAAGGSLAHCVKLTLFLTDLAHFAKVNEAMQKWFDAPYPARSTVGVASLPRGALFEVEAVMVLDARTPSGT
ncbi:MAG: reactive intermediate/imine deaminase [Burkholderiales bacterium]|nr:MAG: reactive intermediate/imine deaminase [Burkholderiales bacterium]